ncbi:hypothetical protein CL630_01580 [bacterium]|nr:hypothetical protein [bacterium]|tara:strand:+ start:10924 stop:11184 length:261 start_codon:yes stop_codon:yes gene_type:complete
MKIIYVPIFIHQFKRLEPTLREEVEEKIELFKDTENHKQLKVHRLKGKLKGRYSFSVNYKIRIVFTYVSKEEVAFLAIGDHSVYDR